MKTPKGYTVIEVLIFLATSGAMFSMAYIGIMRDQDSVGFRNAINSIELKIRQAMNDVDNGYSQNAGQYNCKKTGPNLKIELDSSGGGNSYECVFLGKIVEFNANQIVVRTLVGHRFGTLTNQDDLKETSSLPYNLRFNPASTANWIKAERARNVYADDEASDILTDDIRARWYASPNSGVTWNLITPINPQKLCFQLDQRKAVISIYENDMVVEYDKDC